MWIVHLFGSKITSDIQSNLDSSNTDDSFIMANSNSFFESLRNFSDSSTKQIFKESLFHHEMVCVLIRSPHRGDSNGYTRIEDRKDFSKLSPFAS